MPPTITDDDDTPAPKATEREVLDVLDAHYSVDRGAGPAFAFLRQVRNAASFDASRTFDAVVVSLWKSGGYEIHVIEVKVSRADLLRELADPAKSQAAMDVADRFSIAAPAGLVQQAELPAAWGLITLHGGTIQHEEPVEVAGRTITASRVVGRKVRVQRRAKLLSGPGAGQPVDRTFLVPLLRASGAVRKGGLVHTDDVERMVSERVASRMERERRDHEREIESLRAHRDRLQNFMRQAGIAGRERDPEFAGKVQALLEDGPPDMRRIASQLEFLTRDAQDAAKTLARIRDRLRAPLDAMTPDEVAAVLR